VWHGIKKMFYLATRQLRTSVLESVLSSSKLTEVLAKGKVAAVKPAGGAGALR